MASAHPTAAAGHLAPAWREAYPADEFERVVACVAFYWKELAGRGMPKFHLGQREDKLTKFFNSWLEKVKSERGILGHFISESVHGEPDLEFGELRNERRTDIRYISKRTDLTITFEFKKLKASRRSQLAYYKEGMDRFVGGHYARDCIVGVMIGLVGSDAAAAVSGLEQVLGDRDIQAELRMLPCPRGQHIRKPSNTLPIHAEFDTEHSRTRYESVQEILLCHLFLTTPDAQQPARSSRSRGKKAAETS